MVIRYVRTSYMLSVMGLSRNNTNKFWQLSSDHLTILISGHMRSTPLADPGEGAFRSAPPPSPKGKNGPSIPVAVLGEEASFPATRPLKKVSTKISLGTGGALSTGRPLGNNVSPLGVVPP